MTADELLALAVALGAETVAGWSAEERALVRRAARLPAAAVARARERIAAGEDPLGEAFCALRPPAERRARGATYTPPAIVEAMIAWAAGELRPARVVDPGAGSGRFAVAAGRRFPAAELVAVELDPVAALLARGHLAAAGLARRARVRVEDFRAARLGSTSGPTLFIGNPPYVRHHLLDARWKQWLTRRARERGLPASQLAGLHVHFFLATLLAARRGDAGAFVTAAEWLDVGYGALVRALFAGELGGRALHLVAPAAQPFPDALATAAIACFRVGEPREAVRLARVARVDALGALDGGRAVPRERLRATGRWTPLFAPRRRAPRGWVELGELARVRRGQVTGANRFWIDGPHSARLPAGLSFPTVTRARELYAAGRVLDDGGALRRVIDLPEDLDALSAEARRAVLALLDAARAAGVDRGYIARHRRAWWRVGLHEPAPILATYMARRPPGFVVNRAGARHINIAHGIYPRETMSDRQLVALAEHLASTASVADGRTYAGGLTKFEPREMERLLVPQPELLNSI